MGYQFFIHFGRPQESKLRAVHSSGTWDVSGQVGQTPG